MPAAGRKGAKAITAGRAEVFPTSMSRLAHLIDAGDLPIDGALLSGVRGGDGTISPGLALDVGAAAARHARFRALELNACLPRTRSSQWIAPDECDRVVDVEWAPPVAEWDGSLTSSQRTIGGYVAELMQDGSAFELGVGHGLQGVAAALCDAGRRSLALHTGLIDDTARTLVEGGVVDWGGPCAAGACVVATVARGSQAFYAWVDENPAVRLVESSDSHDVAHLLSLGRFVAINSAGEVDLMGQIGARDAEHALGGGGLHDFATAGAYSGGSIVALTARSAKGRTRIVPRVAHVQVSAQLVTHVVTEYGTADLRGKTVQQRARSLTALAHPQDREALGRAAGTL
jgi:acyl-CoA hydrolase